MAEFTLKPTLVSGKLAVHDFNGYEYKQGGSILCENTMARVVSTDNGGVYFYSLDESESGKVTLRHSYMSAKDIFAEYGYHVMVRSIEYISDRVYLLIAAVDQYVALAKIEQDGSVSIIERHTLEYLTFPVNSWSLGYNKFTKSIEGVVWIYGETEPDWRNPNSIATQRVYSLPVSPDGFGSYEIGPAEASMWAGYYPPVPLNGPPFDHGYPQDLRSRCENFMGILTREGPVFRTSLQPIVYPWSINMWALKRSISFGSQKFEVTGYLDKSAYLWLTAAINFYERSFPAWHLPDSGGGMSRYSTWPNYFVSFPDAPMVSPGTAGSTYVVFRDKGDGAFRTTRYEDLASEPGWQSDLEELMSGSFFDYQNRSFQWSEGSEVFFSVGDVTVPPENPWKDFRSYWELNLQQLGTYEEVVDLVIQYFGSVDAYLAMLNSGTSGIGVAFKREGMNPVYGRVHSGFLEGGSWAFGTEFLGISKSGKFVTSHHQQLVLWEEANPEIIEGAFDLTRAIFARRPNTG